MRTVYSDLNIQFTIDDTQLSALNIVYETFQRTVPQHSHGSSSFEIHYIPFGQGKVILDGVSYDVTPNTLYVTGPHVEHAQIPDTQDPMIEYCILLQVKSKQHKLGDYSCHPYSHSYLDLFYETRIWFGQDTQDIHALMQQLFHELDSSYTGYMTQVETLLAQLVVKLIRNYQHRKESQKHFAPSNLGDSKSIIIEEAFLYEYEHITLEKLAYRLGLSTRQTERFIRSSYNKTFLQKKTEAKMAVAALRLSDPSTKITDIAFELGYSSIEHFSHAFRKYYGITARQYRKEHTN